MDEVAAQLYKEFGFAFICGENGNTKEVKHINRLLNDFVARHKPECAPIISKYRNNTPAMFNNIEALIKKTEPDLMGLVYDINHPPKTEDEIKMRMYHIAILFTSRHSEYDKKFCGIYTGEAMREIISVLPKLEPGLMERVTYL